MKFQSTSGVFLGVLICFGLGLSACSQSTSSFHSSVKEEVSEESDLLSSLPSNLPAELTLAAESSVTGQSHSLEGGRDGGVIGDPNGGDNEGGDGGVIERPRLPAELVANPSAYDFGVKSLRSISHAVIQISNIGEMEATSILSHGLEGAFQFRDGAYPGTLGDCQQSLAPGATCQLVVSFRPESTILYESVLSINYQGGALSVPLRGRGTGIATLQISNLINANDYYSFGQQTYGSETVKTFRVLYSGVKPATGVTFSGVSESFSMIQNDCGAVVSADCDLTIAFHANRSGVQSRKLKVTYHNSAYSAEATHDLYGEASPETIPATLQIDNYNFGDRLIGGRYERVLRVRKSGNLSASGITPRVFAHSAFSFKGGTYPGTGGTCSGEIRTDCLLVVNFTPDEPGYLRDAVVLDYFNGRENRSVQNQLTGNPVLPAFLTITPASGFSADFGNIALNYPRDQVFILRNGSGNLRAVNVVLPQLNDPFRIVASNCGSTLSRGKHCSITVRFTPASTEEVSSVLMAHYYDGLENQASRLEIKGHGDNGAKLTFGGESYDFGSIIRGESTYIDIEIYYFGQLVADGCEITLGDPTGGGGGGPVFGFPGGDPFGTGTCTPDGINQRCRFRVVFTPVSEMIYRTEIILTYQTGTGTTETITVPIQGEGLIVEPANLHLGSLPDFGRIPVGATKSAIVTIQRDGELSATGITANLSGEGFRFVGGEYPGQGGNCGSEIGLHETSCSLALEFAPALVGMATGVISVQYFDGVQPQQVEANLRGEGFRAAHLAMLGLPFGKMPLGESREAVATVTNTGTESATNLSVEGVAEPFEVVSNGCGDSLAPSEQCEVTVRVSSSRPGQFNQQLKVNYHNGEQSTDAKAMVDAKTVVDTKVAANGYHSCARTELGALKCWGHGGLGQLGTGSTANLGVSSGQMGDALSEVSVGSDRWVKSLALGDWHTCAVLDDGSLKCWGNNSHGQLGMGSDVPSIGGEALQMGDALLPVSIGEGVTDVVAGYQHTCALTDSGRVACFGDNSEGQLGLGDRDSRGLEGSDLSNVFVELDGRAVSLSAGPSHTCALLENGALKCWGNNLFGQLALGHSENQGDDPDEMGSDLEAVSIGEGRSLRQVAAGGAFTCGLDDLHQVRCWGRNENGILGGNWCQDSGAQAGLCNDTRFIFELPGLGISLSHLEQGLALIDLGDDFSVRSISAGNGSACALSVEGRVKCWGENRYGQLGLGDTDSRGLVREQMGIALPVIALGSSATEISVGSQHACAVLEDNRIRCWGHNKYGALGVGNTEDRGDEAGEMPTPQVGL